MYSGIVDILVRHLDSDQVFLKLLASDPGMNVKQYFVRKAQDYARQQARLVLEGRFPIDKFVLSRSLRAEYKDAERIKHKVLADRANDRGTDSFQSNDRIHFVHIVKRELKGQKLLQGEKIETVEYVREHGLQVDYRFYLANQIEKPISQLLALGLQDLQGYNRSKHTFPALERELRDLRRKLAAEPDRTNLPAFVEYIGWKETERKTAGKLAEKRQAAAADITFGQLLRLHDSKLAGNQPLTNFFKRM